MEKRTNQNYRQAQADTFTAIKQYRFYVTKEETKD